jgi:hypothetical protein
MSFYKKTIKQKLLWRKYFFFINITTMFKSRKILKMENKHPSIFDQHEILYQKIKKKSIFEIF